MKPTWPCRANITLGRSPSSSSSSSTSSSAPRPAPLLQGLPPPTLCKMRLPCGVPLNDAMCGRMHSTTNWCMAPLVTVMMLCQVQEGGQTDQNTSAGEKRADWRVRDQDKERHRVRRSAGKVCAQVLLVNCLATQILKQQFIRTKPKTNRCQTCDTNTRAITWAIKITSLRPG